MRAKDPLLSCAVGVCFLFPCEPVRAADPVDSGLGIADFSKSNTVSIVLGADEVSLGLKHVNRVGDGVSVVEDMNGVPARKATLKGNSEWVYFYFALDPAFKSQDLRRVKIEVEYFDAAPGTMGIHYDSLNAEGGPGSKYMDADAKVELVGSSQWQKAVFHTRNDGGFQNRQNGEADFRIRGKTPTLYIGRVTVTRDPLNENWTTDYSKSNRVNLVLGQEKATDGLRHLTEERDGQTVLTNLNGEPARKATLQANRESVYFYFALAPTFKSQDVRRVKIEVDYFDPAPGAMGIHYDSLDGEDGPGSKYMDANRPIALTGSGRWQKAVFHTRNDGGFKNRQNSQADFRIWGMTPTLYVGRVTVTRDPLNENWTTDYSKSNRVSLVLGQEKATDGLRHLTEESDGQTVSTNLAGEPCCYLNRTREGRPFGSFYFQISPSFKRSGLKNARVEVEYLSRLATGFRVQYHGQQGGASIRYLPVLAEGAEIMRYPTGADYGRISNNGAWETATFHLTNALFQNSQKGGADFRIEVVPPELYIRRVTIIRE